MYIIVCLVLVVVVLELCVYISGIVSASCPDCANRLLLCCVVCVVFVNDMERCNDFIMDTFFKGMDPNSKWTTND